MLAVPTTARKHVMYVVDNIILLTYIASTKMFEGKTMIDEDLLAILACPKCKGALKYLEEKEGLACEKCMLLYEIRDNIPVMLIEEARALTREDLA